MAVPHTIGSYWMHFDDTADAYPTDGRGAIGSGSLTTASHLAGVSRCIIDGVLLTHASFATLRTWTLKDALGNTLLSTTATGTPAPTAAIGNVTPVWIPFGREGLLINTANGFTMQTDNTAVRGTLFYRIVRTTPA